MIIVRLKDKSIDEQEVIDAINSAIAYQIEEMTPDAPLDDEIAQELEALEAIEEIESV